ncbi:MAG TPA: alcohol dehydrogenase catalytic domain-containing protein [Kribbella sp.]|uniref:zinc-dependent alcohol dehydrogenase n=1 Tax=Kribbella sp. TaxID=1871183 RepID=UPI002D78C20C|nr:alcohol dehydrogenase catalytic domain-containing protein [Kribbella sp.]HET6297727.1 alcohol dehydrogenase catalytic domain-containing protein [Kribbella sp.]
MSAVRWYGPRDLRVEAVATPRPSAGEVLVRVERVGLCGSDLEEYREGPVSIPPDAIPLTLGHEVVGTVVACPGEEVAVGTRVIPDVVVGCRHCWWCDRNQEGLCPDLPVRGQQQDGGLAEYMLADARTTVVVPPAVELDVAAFAEPCAVAVRALRKAGDLTGAVVCIYGAGTVGLSVAQAALSSSAAAVVAVDPVASRRRLASDFGAIACSPDEAVTVIRDLTDGRGADVVLECAGVPQAPAAVELSRRGATIVLVGFRADRLVLPWLDVVLGERHLIGSAAHLWDEDVTAAVAMLARGTFNPRPLHTTTMPLTETPAAFQHLDQDPTVLKILIRP